MRNRLNAIGFVLALAAFLSPPAAAAAAAQGVVNVYSARHYDTDDAVYAAFTEETGIEVRLIEGDSDALLARLKAEGELSPADVFITVDAGRLHRAVEQGVFRETDSETLDGRVPANLRHPDGLWFGLTKRARVVVFDPDRIGREEVDTYAELADPSLGDRLLVRSSGNVYNQSLVAALIERLGPDGALAWCEGVVANLARKPQGGDRDQVRAVAAGEGDAAVVNHYYFARMLAGDDPDDRAAAEGLELVFPDQDGEGTHVNVSGAGVVKNAPNPENAVRFVEFLTSDATQRAYAAGNYEYPVVEGVPTAAVLESFGDFEADDLNAAVLGDNNAEAVRVMDRAGWR